MPLHLSRRSLETSMDCASMCCSGISSVLLLLAIHRLCRDIVSLAALSASGTLASLILFHFLRQDGVDGTLNYFDAVTQRRKVYRLVLDGGLLTCGLVSGRIALYSVRASRRMVMYFDACMIVRRHSHSLCMRAHAQLEEVIPRWYASQEASLVCSEDIESGSCTLQVTLFDPVDNSRSVLAFLVHSSHNGRFGRSLISYIARGPIILPLIIQNDQDAETTMNGHGSTDSFRGTRILHFETEECAMNQMLVASIEAPSCRTVAQDRRRR